MPLRKGGGVPLPVVDVHRDNFVNFWPSILFACKTADFIALDAELSGLGPRNKLTLKDLNERYKAISDVARTRAVLSLGVSCFRYIAPSSDQSNDATDTPMFSVQTYNITTLCNEDYMVEPAALQFLVDHGFDFNKQYSKGILYHPGADKKTEKASICVRNLFSEILRGAKPVVVHNGLLDMVFLYQHFYAPLPPSYPQFVVDLSEMFHGGLFDTKYLAEFVARIPASYLEYVFRWCQKENHARAQSGEKNINLTYQEYEDQPFVEYHCLPLPGGNALTGASQQKICRLYSAFGHCKKKSCDESHDLDAILEADFRQAEQKKKRRKRKRKLKVNPSRRKDGATGCNDDGTVTNTENAEPPTKVDRTGAAVDTEQGSTVSHENCKLAEEASLQQEGEITEMVSWSTKSQEESGLVAEPLGGHSVDVHQIKQDSKHASHDNTDQWQVGNNLEDLHTDVDLHANPQGDSLNEIHVGSANGGGDVGSCGESKAGKGPASIRHHGSHRAGFDAFMTGYAMACIVCGHGKFPAEGGESTSLLNGLWISKEANKLFLAGKDVPMLVKKSAFAKTSQAHREKIKKIEDG